MSEAVPAYQRTAEHERFMSAWDSALQRPEWETFLNALKEAFPAQEIGGGTQPFVSGCTRHQVYRTEPLSDDARLATRIVAAVSVLAPVYIVYVMTQVWSSTDTPVQLGNGEVWRRYHSSRPQLTFEPCGTARDEMETLARIVEAVLGLQRFPLAFADVPLPDLRVGFLNGEGPPKLIEAIFSEQLENLP